MRRAERFRRLPRTSAFWIGTLVGAGVIWCALELSYVDWRSIVPPIDERPVVVRQDAKGDGRYRASRSGSRRHRGIDLGAPLDSPVRAVRSGRVIQVGIHRGLGRFVELEHADRLISLYAHLNEARVTVGQRVAQGEVIGAVGKTGNARHPWIEPHVHLEVTRDGAHIDPTTLGLDVVVSSPEGSRHGRGGH